MIFGMAIWEFFVYLILPWSIIIWGAVWMMRQESGVDIDLWEQLRYADGADIPIKLWLDDERPAPAGWIRVYRMDDMCYIIERFPVVAISLDHDLGIGETDGYYVLNFLEQRAYEGRSIPADINIHSANYAARPRMDSALEQIRRYEQDNKT